MGDPHDEWQGSAPGGPAQSRTVCQPGGDGRVVWNATFKQFADYWGFEPHLCRAYRAQTKGKVESGVKYFKRNFLPGRIFVDEQDLRAQLGQWQAEIANVRIHGTTHERPTDRFGREQSALIATGGQPGFRLEASQPQRVADDYARCRGNYRLRKPIRSPEGIGLYAPR